VIDGVMDVLAGLDAGYAFPVASPDKVEAVAHAGYSAPHDSTLHPAR
jgi:hypothetical protein